MRSGRDPGAEHDEVSGHVGGRLDDYARRAAGTTRRSTDQSRPLNGAANRPVGVRLAAHGFLGFRQPCPSGSQRIADQARECRTP